MTVQGTCFGLLDQAFPFALAEEWDNVGSLLGDARREVSGCVVALDATEEALDFARARGANLLVTHHPVLFRARQAPGGGRCGGALSLPRHPRRRFPDCRAHQF